MRALRWVLLVAASCFALHAEAYQAPDSYMACTVGNPLDSAHPFCAASFELLGHMICDHGDYRFDHYDLVGDYGTPSAYGANARCLRISWNQLDPINYGMWIYGHCPGDGWTPMYMRDGLENQTCPGVDPQCVLTRTEALGTCDTALAAGLYGCGLLTYIPWFGWPEFAICSALEWGIYFYCKSQAPTC
jgi:hypothetical protein